MKKTLILIAIIAIVVAGFLSTRGAMPFLPVFGASMYPTYKAGDLIFTEEASASDIEIGDVIIFSVPSMTRQLYNYPALVAHRVVEKRDTAAGITFRTRGDNTGGQDPFTVRPQDIKGTVGKRIPYLGFPLLFFQSTQGLVFVVIALCLLAIYFYGGEITEGRQIVHRRLLGPVLEENRRSNRIMEKSAETTATTMQSTQEALQSFSSAIAEYAVHLKSHTTAIQGLSDASQELKQGAGEQNRVLANIAKAMEQAPPGLEQVPPPAVASEEAPPVEKDVIPEPKKAKPLLGHYHYGERHIGKETLAEKQRRFLRTPSKPKHTAAAKASKPHTELAEKALAEKEPVDTEHTTDKEDATTRKPSLATRHTLTTKEALAKKRDPQTSK